MTRKWNVLIELAQMLVEQTPVCRAVANLQKTVWLVILEILIKEQGVLVFRCHKDDAFASYRQISA